MTRLALLGVLLLVLVGCALDGAIRAANVAGDVATAAHGVLSEVYEAEQLEAAEVPDLTMAKQRVADIRARFRPAWKAYRVLRAAWVMAAALLRAAQIDGSLSDRALGLVAGLVAQQVALADALAALGLEVSP